VVKRGVRWALFVTFFVVGAQNLCAQRPYFTVAVCDQVTLSSQILASARQQSIDIFRKAGVDVTWIDLDVGSKCAVPAGIRNCFVMVILPKAPKDAASPEAMGHAPNRTGWIPRAYVFYNWVQIMVDIVERKHFAEEGRGILLGHAIAHELGHLLLPERPHSLRGIMSTEWHYSHWEDAVAGRLLFNDAEAKAIRGELERK
jgi:hypothetical protein